MLTIFGFSPRHGGNSFQLINGYPFARTFLKAYGNSAVLAELRKQLVIPSGLARIWWNVRTNFVNNAQS
jgi:hypothetical protein